MSGYNNGRKKLKGIIDWGEVYPSLSLFSKQKYDGDSKITEYAIGATYSKSNWGVIAEFAWNGEL